MLQPKKITYKEVEEQVKKLHVIQAALNLKKKGYPENRGSRDWHVPLEGRRFPPKVLLEEALQVATGLQVDVSNFDQGGEATTNKLLRNLGFQVEKGKSN